MFQCINGEISTKEEYGTKKKKQESNSRISNQLQNKHFHKDLPKKGAVSFPKLRYTAKKKKNVASLPEAKQIHQKIFNFLPSV